MNVMNCSKNHWEERGKKGHHWAWHPREGYSISHLLVAAHFNKFHGLDPADNQEPCSHSLDQVGENATKGLRVKTMDGEGSVHQLWYKQKADLP